jgi:hypothetical protein
MDEVGPTAVGMKAIASTAMRKVASYNQRGLMASVSQGTVKAALGQALNSGVNPLHAAASVTDGLVGAATEASARRGANSAGTAKAISEATMQAVVESAGGLGISVQGAANAAAFGAMNASLTASVDYGTNSLSMARDVTSGLATGAINGSLRMQAEPAPSAQAVLHGATDSVYTQSEQHGVNPTPLVNAAQAGFNQALAAANLLNLTEGGADSESINNDILGSMLDFGGKIVQMKKIVIKDGKEVEVTQLVLIPNKPITETVTWDIFHEQKQVGQKFAEPTYDLGEEITEEEVGQYKFIARREDGTEVLSKTKNVFLINKPLPPVSPSS